MFSRFISILLVVAFICGLYSCASIPEERKASRPRASGRDGAVGD